MSQGDIAKTQLQIFQGMGYIGKRFGMLVVLDDTMAVGKPKKKAKVLCRCDCGKTVMRTIDNIERGRTQSCGCISRLAQKKVGERSAKDLAGKRFGKLTAIRIAGKNNRGYENLWECKCDCGKIKYAVTSNLTLGRTTHCGKGCGFAYPKKKKKIPIDREQFAKDAYCIFKKVGSLRDASRLCGYSCSSYFTVLFNTYIPGYRKASKKRRDASASGRPKAARGKRSRLFRFEKDFQEYVLKTLLHRVKTSESVVNRSVMEIDILVDDSIIIELKITSRKVDIARALGQCLINKNTFQGDVAGQIICVPDDVQVYPDVISACVNSNVVFCSAAELIAAIDQLRAENS